MKALKEKRISLRSLWRRGLVILSLFALVFASCGESSGVDDSGGSPIRYIQVKDNPANDQYYGRPVDLTGTTIEVTYENGKKEIITDTSKFTAYPRIVTGYYMQTMPHFVGMGSCKVTYKDATAWADFDGKVWGIWPTNTLDMQGYGPIDKAGKLEGLYDLGIHLVGREKLKKNAYVDDEEFSLDGLIIEADYFYEDPDTGWIERDWKPISLKDVTWRILPSYEINGDKTSRGQLYVTVGTDFYRFMEVLALRSGSSMPGSYTSKGVTATAPMEAVYIVDKIDLKAAPDLGDYYYWEENTAGAWADRLGPDARLVVSYTGGAADREFLISDLMNRYRPETQKIWHNANPGDEGPEEIAPQFINFDFDIVPVRYPLTAKKNKDPSIVLYYRGAEKEIPVDVLTTLVSVNAVSKDGGDIIFRPAAIRDNDRNDGIPGTGGLADLITVTATYQAYNNPSVQSKAPLELMYKGHLGNLLGRKYLDSAGNDIAGGKYIPYYSFSKTPDDGLTDDDSAYDKVFLKWEKEERNWREKGKGKDSMVQAVMVGHKVNELELYPAAYDGTTSIVGPITMSVLPPAGTTIAGGGTISSAGPLYNAGVDEPGLEYLRYDPAASTYVAKKHFFYKYDPNPATEDIVVPNFLETLKKSYYRDVITGIDHITWQYVSAWDTASPRSLDLEWGTGTDSGLKVAKARTYKPAVTWIIKE